ncbi:MAG: class I SAM-dependent RNA methyltransferase [Nitrospirae bacterium]|nr:class I SAM-dependent RNA methyltransferase [Nitrospirota bacterium]
MTIKAESPAYGGRSIGKLNGKIVMIKGAIPGEVVKVRIEEDKKDYSLGTAVSLDVVSPQRCVPECIYFGACGGCQLQFMTHELQVSIKEKILTDCIKRITKIDTELSPSVVSSSPWNYRLRGQFKISHGKIGFYREKSRDVVDINACPLMTQEINVAFAKARALLGKVSTGEIHISFGSGAFALLKTSQAAVEGIDMNKLARTFLDSGFSGTIIEMAGRKAIRLGKQFMTLDLDTLKYTISQSSFFQSNWQMNLAVVSLLKKALQPLQGQKIMDLFSGAGNFSIPLALDACEVVAIEENADAVRDGRRNAEINGISNCVFINSAVDSAAITEDIDILAMDPPRPGLTDKVIQKILGALPLRIAYVSCNPSTLARDLKKMLVRYEIESVRLIDFFPQTYHIESLALLRRTS